MRRPSNANFWGLAAVIGLVFAAASAPSPLYVVYQGEFSFSSTTLTLIFAVYVVTLLLTLLFAGSVSDYVGRRPVVITSLLVLILAMLLFILAKSVTMLFAARIVQGVGTGLATGAVGAAILDFQPAESPGLASVTNAVAPLIGLAVGALLSGCLVQYAEHPLRLVYWVLVAALFVSLIFVLLLPETVERQAGWWHTLKPSVNVPLAVRPTFAAVTPGLIATWALGGLYLSLGPSIVLLLTQSTNHVVGAMVIVALSGAGAMAVLSVRHVEASITTWVGALFVAAGVGITLIGIRTEEVGFVFAGSVVAGCGFGAAFAGALRTLISITPPTARAGMLSAVFIVSYTAFSVPAIIAGIFVPHDGLQDVASVYAIAIMCFAVITAIRVARLRQPAPAENQV